MTIDITDRKEAEERQSLLAREVDHRAKNALAVVHADRLPDPGRQHQAIRRRGRRPHPGAGAGAQPAVRIRAGAAPTSPSWSTTNSRPIARRISTGSGLSAGASRSILPTAQALALVLHELATNAAQIRRDVVAVRRRRGRLGSERDGNLELRWTESGGPPVEHSASRRISASASSRQASNASWAAPSNSNGAPTGSNARYAFRINCDWSFRTQPGAAIWPRPSARSG